MAEFAAVEARHYGLGDLESMNERLLAALVSGIEHKNVSLFNQTLAHILQDTLARDEDIYIWHAAISALQNEMAQERPSSKFSQMLLNQAHLTISEQSRRQITGALIHQMEMAERLGWMTSQLLAVLDTEQIAAILAEHLPGIGIRHMQAALFVPEEDDAVAASQLILRCRLEGALSSNQFITRHFPLPDFSPPDEPFQLAVLPLIIQGENVGFVALDVESRTLRGHHAQSGSGAAKQPALP
jgi:hypothetical protein